MDEELFCQPTCRTVLLSDEPAEQDEFGAHKEVADAIAELITTERGGRCIGLEGVWGSGKSTVIRILGEALEPEKDTTDSTSENTVVVFDAWAHQGDPLRRTFLVKAISRFLAKYNEVTPLVKSRSRTNPGKMCWRRYRGVENPRRLRRSQQCHATRSYS